MKRLRTIQTLVVPPLGGAVRGLSLFHVARGRRQNRLKAELRTGFTLVEMLVAVTLVLLMMVMFGEMFQLASASVTKQRVMADNDQNARTFVTVIRADLDKRSFRSLVPFYANEPPDLGTPFGFRRGYFYISNNNLFDGTDDVLQFTVDASVKVQNTDTSQYFGRAVALPGNLLFNPNQPDRDDLQITPNEAGASRAAEIAYWMRGGKLYRRAMLLRDPILDSGGTSSEPYQPTSNTGVDYFRASSAPPYTGTPIYTGNIWNDFDYSVHRLPPELIVPPVIAPYAIFNGMEYLNNAAPPLTPLVPGSWTPALGQPWNRFGHNHHVTPGSTLNGLPREFSASTAPNFFIGRFIHQETSDPNFQYPHLPAVGIGALGNPMDGDTGTTPLNVLQDTAPRDGVIDQFATGGRVGVDLLLSHVQEFRVEVWDERLNDFVPVGHSQTTAGGVPGDYHISRQLNPTYGPLGGLPHVLDTWHPRFNRNNNVDASSNPIFGDVPDRPPFRPLNWDPTGLSGVVPPSPAPVSAGTVQGYWEPGQTYAPGHIVFPRREDLNGNGYLDPNEDLPGANNGFTAGDGQLQENVSLTVPPVIGLITEDINNSGTLDLGEDGLFGLPVNGSIDTKQLRDPLYPTGLTFAYRCINGGVSASASATPSILDEPFTGAAARTPGQIIRGRRDRDLNGDGDTSDIGEVDFSNPPDNIPNVFEPDWLVEYNVRPLRAIRITVRFEHPTSKQMKQVTIVHSLRDTTAVP